MTDDRLQRLLDAEAIREVRSRYCWAYDRNDLNTLLGVFADDAVCVFGPFGTWTGIEEIRAGYSATLEVHQGRTMHAITNPVVRVDGDTAHGEYYLLDFLFGGAGESPLKIIAHYLEDYRRAGDDWLITRSEIRFVWNEDQGYITGEAARPASV